MQKEEMSLQALMYQFVKLKDAPVVVQRGTSLKTDLSPWLSRKADSA